MDASSIPAQKALSDIVEAATRRCNADQSKVLLERIDAAITELRLDMQEMRATIDTLVGEVAGKKKAVRSEKKAAPAAAQAGAAAATTTTTTTTTPVQAGEKLPATKANYFKDKFVTDAEFRQKCLALSPDLPGLIASNPQIAAKTDKNNQKLKQTATFVWSYIRNHFQDFEKEIGDEYTRKKNPQKEVDEAAPEPDTPPKAVA